MTSLWTLLGISSTDSAGATWTWTVCSFLTCLGYSEVDAAEEISASSLASKLDAFSSVSDVIFLFFTFRVTSTLGDLRPLSFLSSPCTDLQPPSEVLSHLSQHRCPCLVNARKVANPSLVSDHPWGLSLLLRIQLPVGTSRSYPQWLLPPSELGGLLKVHVHPPCCFSMHNSSFLGPVWMKIKSTFFTSDAFSPFSVLHTLPFFYRMVIVQRNCLA